MKKRVRGVVYEGEIEYEAVQHDIRPSGYASIGPDGEMSVGYVCRVEEFDHRPWWRRLWSWCVRRRDRSRLR